MSTAGTSDHEERVCFENWREDGCHVFVDNKHVLTLHTPESCLGGCAPEDCFIEDWISPDEYCPRLETILRALGASDSVLAAVEQERMNYRGSKLDLPSRDREAEFQTILGMAV